MKTQPAWGVPALQELVTIKWGLEGVSNLFQNNMGVKQGYLLFSAIFGLYIDNVSESIEKVGEGEGAAPLAQIWTPESL